MREILVGIREDQERELSRLARASGTSRAALIRRAIDGMLGEETRSTEADAFGLWGKADQDGLAYEREMRGEW
jgi:predicted transcriptional regulator